jgi:hypothetical protein
MPLLPVLRAPPDASQVPPASFGPYGPAIKNRGLSRRLQAPRLSFSNRDKLFGKQRFDNLSEYRNGLKINRLRIVKSVLPLL